MHVHHLHIHKNGITKKVMLFAGILVGAAVIVTGGFQVNQSIAPHQSHAAFQTSSDALDTAYFPEASQELALSVSEQISDTPLQYTSPIAATDADFRQRVLESPLPVLVMFWADWCSVSQQAEPALEAAAIKFSSRLAIVTIDIDRNHNTTAHYEVHGTPTFLLFQEGAVIGRQSGFGGQPHLFGFIQRYL
jgi:thioredoxin 1